MHNDTISLLEANTISFLKKLNHLFLDPYEFRVYLWLYSRIDKQGRCDDSIQVMVDGCNICDKRIKTALKALQEKGLLVRQDRVGKRSIWIIKTI